MFILNQDTGDIDMHVGDTGSVTVHAVRASGTAWGTSGSTLAYMEFTVSQRDGTPVLQRYYKIPTSGDMEIKFENEDTDFLDPGTYNMERRYIINPIWSGTAPTGTVINALTSQSKITDGDIVRTPEKGQPKLVLRRIYGEV